MHFKAEFRNIQVLKKSTTHWVLWVLLPFWVYWVFGFLFEQAAGKFVG